MTVSQWQPDRFSISHSLVIGPVASALVVRFGGQQVGLVSAVVNTAAIIAVAFCTTIVQVYISYGLVAGANIFLNPILWHICIDICKRMK